MMVVLLVTTNKIRYRKLFMQKFLLWPVFLVLLFSLGCGSPSVTGSKAPPTEEERIKIAEDDRKIEDEESPRNKNLRGNNRSK